MLPRVFDTDQHLIESSDFWTDRFPKKYQHRVPVFVDSDEMGNGWSWDGGKSIRPMGLQSSSSEDPRRLSDRRRLDDIDPGCYDAKKRIEAMDTDGVEACLLFPPSVPPAFSNILGDDDFYVACSRVYNDAVMDWARGGNPDRILPAAFIPMCGIESALAEIDRTARLGFEHYLLNMYPSGGKMPTPYDEPLWDKLEETGMVVSMHGFRGGHIVKSSGGAPLPAGGARAQEMTAAGRGAGLGSTELLAAFIFSGVLERHPNLKAAMIETSLGWLPFFAEQMDNVYLQHRWLRDSKLKGLPSESLRRIYANSTASGSA